MSWPAPGAPESVRENVWPGRTALIVQRSSGAVQVTTTTAIAAQAVETACDECAGDGQLAYDLEATMWVPRSATADWPADDRIGISVLDCLQCDGTGTVRLDPGRGNRPTRSGR